jgi:hypothetical protein
VNRREGRQPCPRQGSGSVKPLMIHISKIICSIKKFDHLKSVRQEIKNILENVSKN